jgi:hypothetical protein
MTTTIDTGHLYEWLIAPTAQGGLGLTVLGAMYWLAAWDGVTIPSAAADMVVQDDGSKQ